MTKPTPEQYKCMDCNEEYPDCPIVQDSLWRIHAKGNPRGVLCAGCLQNRMGRPFTSDDLKTTSQTDLWVDMARLAGMKFPDYRRENPIGEYNHPVQAYYSMNHILQICRFWFRRCGASMEQLHALSVDNFLFQLASPEIKEQVKLVRNAKQAQRDAALSVANQNSPSV